MRAALIVRDPDGSILEVPDPVAVDPVSVIREVIRLRRRFGRRVSIDSSQIIAARQAMKARKYLVSA